MSHEKIKSKLDELDKIISLEFPDRFIDHWQSNWNDNDELDPTAQQPMFTIYTSIKRCMKEYAEYYAKRCLEVASTNAKTVRCPDYDKVNANTILNITLPEHD